MVETMSKPAAIPSGAVKIDVAAQQIKRAPASARYWVGVMVDAPFDNDTRGGLTFMKFKGKLPMDDAGRIDLNQPHERGDIVELTPSQVELVRKRVANIVLRTGVARDVVKDDLGNNVSRERTIIRGRIALDSVAYSVDKDRKGEKSPSMPYSPQHDDVPLGYFLYMMKVPESAPIGWRTEKPERMCDSPSMVLAG